MKHGLFSLNDMMQSVAIKQMLRMTAVRVTEVVEKSKRTLEGSCILY